MRGRKAWGLVAVLAVVGLGGWWWLGRGAGAAPPAQSAAVARAEKRTLEVVAEASGLVEPVRVVEVKSKASGEVLRVLAETGQRVERGALLAEIDPRDVQNVLAQAQADLEAARVRAQTSGANRKRMEELRGSGVVTQGEYEAAVEGAASARAEQVRAETNLQLARERRNDVTIRAPIDGTVIERTVEPGIIIASATSNVSGGTTLFKMADLTTMQVRAKVDETDIGKVRPGQTARVSVEAHPGRTFVGEVLKVEPQAVVEQNVTLFPVLVRLDNAQGLLSPGMNAEVTVEVARRPDVTTVPNGAVVSVRDARAAAVALGLGEDAVRSALQRPGAGGGGADGGSGGGAAAAAVSPECAALRERVMAAGGPAGLTEEERTQLRACRQAAGGGAGGGGGRRGAGAGSGGGGGDTRPGIVFVQVGGKPEPRRVVLGLSDWENTEVVRGVEPGDEVVLVSVAQLQQSQQQFQQRVRERAGGGVVPGGGGGGGPRR